MIQTIFCILILLGSIYFLFQACGYDTSYDGVTKEGFRVRSQNFVPNNRFDNANMLGYGEERAKGLYETEPGPVVGPSSVTGVNKNSDVDIYDNRGFKWSQNGSDPKVDAFVNKASNEELRNKFQRTYMLDPSGKTAQYDITYDNTSVNCCPAQYSPPFKLSKDGSNCEYAQKYVANQYSGMNFDSGTGCVCVSPKQAAFYGSRGGNGSGY